MSVFGFSFGALAADTGLSPLKASALSLLVFAGGSQFAAVSLAGAGSEAAGVVTGLLLNSRLAAFGVLAAPLLGASSRWRRAAGAQLVVDEPVVLALEHRDRGVARATFWFAGLVLFACWNVVTLLGAVVGDRIADPATIGLDGAFPAVFVAILAPRMRERGAQLVALVAAIVALGLTPLLPAGLPVLLAGLAVLAAGRGRGDGVAP